MSTLDINGENGECQCCGSRAGNRFQSLLWEDLRREWGLSDEEYAYTDRQQGECCLDCGANLRTQALARAILLALGERGPFERFARSWRGRWMRILEINRAGQLTDFFPRRSRHELWLYPQLDMMDMKEMKSGRFDVVIHSDTLEHVPDPVKGLRECHRVLKEGGFCCFTVPLIVGRLTRSREGLPASHHGDPGDGRGDFLVHSEYGADAWRQVLEAGFEECRITAVRPPAAHAITGVKR